MLLPTAVLDIHMIGPNISPLVNCQVLRPRSNLTVTLHHGLYHVVQSRLSSPDIVVGKRLVHLSFLSYFFVIYFVAQYKCSAGICSSVYHEGQW